MRFSDLTKLLVICSSMAIGNVCLAQDDAADRADVWSVVEQQWDAEEGGDKKWMDRYLADDFSGWQKDSPAPRNKSSMQMWDRFMDSQGSMVAHELYPLQIIVHDDVAIAHYMYTSAYRAKGGDVELNNGRFSDVLIRTEDGWRFLSWHGGDDE